MAPSKKCFVAAHLPSDVLERLKQRAAERGQTLRDYCSSALERASSERVDAAPERSTERDEPSSTIVGDDARERPVERPGHAAWVDDRVRYVPLHLRVDALEERGERPIEEILLDAAATRRGLDALPEDAQAAAVLLARELELVRRTSTWRGLVEEGEFNTEAGVQVEADDADPKR